MKYRRLGKTGFEVSEVSLGTWQLGEGWGSVSETDAIRVLETAIGSGVNFFDTADVYGDGRSERIIAQARPGAVSNRTLSKGITRRTSRNLSNAV